MGFLVKINLDEKLYIRNPEQTLLGQKIVSSSIKMIDELGFEKFNFKKLSVEIHTTESSVYRYFENKQQLLIYLVSWYWKWLIFQIDYQTHNIKESEAKLKMVIKVISESVTYDPNFSHIDEVALGRIVISESTKSYLGKIGDDIQDKIFYSGYVELCGKISNIILEFKPNVKIPGTIVTTFIETAHRQLFFSKYLPFLSELKVSGENQTLIIEFLETMLFTMIKVF